MTYYNQYTGVVFLNILDGMIEGELIDGLFFF